MNLFIKQKNTLKTNLWLPMGRGQGRDKLGVRSLGLAYIHYYIYNRYQQRPTV